MSGASGQTGLITTVELKGHLIDSLTLSKVIDRVHQLGGDYRLNDIRIGSLKKDISSINMTLLASDEDTMNRLLAEVAHYGAMPGGTDEMKTVICQQDGVVPEEAYVVKLPQQVRHQGKWQPLQNGGPWVLVLQEGQPRMIPLQELRQGDVLASGTDGLRW